MSDNALHLIKLVVGLDKIDKFAQWQTQEHIVYQGQKVNLVRTRFMPKRADEVLESKGSIYRVISGHIRCRQRIIGFETDENQKRGKHCIILLDTDIMLTHPLPKRAFQGWRYLKPQDAPSDYGQYVAGQTEQSSNIEIELRQIGLI